MLLAKIGLAVAKGMVAGLAGTAAMTVAQAAAMKLRGRGPSTVPAEAVEEVFHFEIPDEETEVAVAQAVHWTYGVSWGIARGLLSLVHAPPAVKAPLHVALVWGTQAALLPRLGVQSPVSEQSPGQVGEDLGLHGLYGAVTDLTWRWLDRRYPA